MRLPRWVVDTNVLVSALLWQGTPGQVIELAGDKEVLLFSIGSFEGIDIVTPAEALRRVRSKR